MADLYRVDEMEALIRTILETPLQAHLSSAAILQAINDGYREVASRALCIEHEQTVHTIVGSRLIPFVGQRVNQVVC